MQPKSRPTIRDVAKKAGVSRQTVSRVINHSKRVSPATRQRVEEAIADLGYRPDALAQSMANGRSGTLACIAPNLTDFTFASLIDGAEVMARDRGFFLLSASAPDEGTFAALVADLVTSRRAEGLIVINPFADDRHLHLPKGFPTVFAGARPRELETSSVALDDVNAAKMATQHLLALGHHQIGCITGPLVEDCAQDRCQGFHQALQEAGITAEDRFIVSGNWRAQSGYAAFGKFVGTGRVPTAIFAQNDQMAAGVLRAARDQGIHVPEQLSVIGIDDIPMAGYLSPPLTTLRQDFQEIGRQATGLLIEAVNYASTQSRQLRLPAHMVIRRSTSRVPAT
jgi:DNA-binding LacI/PurR family transcriptional regulator